LTPARRSETQGLAALFRVMGLVAGRFTLEATLLILPIFLGLYFSVFNYPLETIHLEITQRHKSIHGSCPVTK
jgi:hypothetical protein